MAATKRTPPRISNVDSLPIATRSLGLQYNVFLNTRTKCQAGFFIALLTVHVQSIVKCPDMDAATMTILHERNPQTLWRLSYFPESATGDGWDGVRCLYQPFFAHQVV